MRGDAIQIIEPGVSTPPAEMLQMLGGKAFNLMKLCAAGLPVPPAFVLPTSWCASWIGEGGTKPADFQALVAGSMQRLERASGLGFGARRNPLLVSVRSGAPVSMPGMLDTVLNVGLTRATLPALTSATGNPRLAWDCYLRLIESYAQTVAALDFAPFTAARSRSLEAAGTNDLSDLDTLTLRDLGEEYLQIYRATTGEDFPDDPNEQLLNAVDAVFCSWDSERARSYRTLNGLEGLAGTAVTVQRMVYGNGGPSSGSGVGFTRDPATGEKGRYLDFAFNAQGEDVVSGRRSLLPADQLARILPATSMALDKMAAQLERIFHDAQDFEFTVEDGRLFLLQTRDAKCSPWARLKIAVDLGREGIIAPADVAHRLAGIDLASLVRRRVRAGAGEALAQGIAAGIGVATGAIALSLAEARSMKQSGRKAILVRDEIATQDIDGIAAADGVLTAKGGRTSHAAVVARELGKVAIVGCVHLRIAADSSHCEIGGRRLQSGEEITLDGETGNVYAGPVMVGEERPVEELAQLADWGLSSPSIRGSNVPASQPRSV